MEPKTVLITGATSGIGKETAIDLAFRGWKIIIPSRDITKGELIKQEIQHITGNQEINVYQCDLASFASITQFCQQVKNDYQYLDVLINNAGVWEMAFSETSDGIERNFGINHLAPFLLTHLLIDLLLASPSARIINTSSSAHYFGIIDFDDLEGRKKYSGFKSYSQSKLANVLFTKYLADALKSSPITVNCLHPGVVSTRLFDKMSPLTKGFFRLMMISPKKGAETTIFLATSETVKEKTGFYFHKKKPRKPSKEAENMEIATRLWQVSQEYMKNFLPEVRFTR